MKKNSADQRCLYSAYLHWSMFQWWGCFQGAGGGKMTYWCAFINTREFHSHKSNRRARLSSGRRSTESEEAPSLKIMHHSACLWQIWAVCCANEKLDRLWRNWMDSWTEKHNRGKSPALGGLGFDQSCCWMGSSVSKVCKYAKCVRPHFGVCWVLLGTFFVRIPWGSFLIAFRCREAIFLIM